jgi:hypothetical protein
MIPDYTVVLGVDKKTIEQLKAVWPTWVKHKPLLFKRKFLIFCNYVTPQDVESAIQSTLTHTVWIQWPPKGVTYERPLPKSRDDEKWLNPQRAKMLAGFVHVPARYVTTPYWLKLDLDVIANSHYPATSDGDWVCPEWFDGNPSIIASSWSYTKPPTQMLQLDEWVAKHAIPVFRNTEPLNLRPNPGSDKVIHPRIASWCSFYSTEFTKLCSQIATDTCGLGQLPVDSQDGFMWYVAARGGFTIRTVKMKKHGWSYRSSMRTIEERVVEVMR